MRTKFALAIAALALTGTALAQTSSNTTADSSVRLMQPISLAKDADMAFGTVVKPSSGNGVYTIGAGSDALSVSGTGAAASAGSTSRAKLTATGEGGQSFAITVPSTMTMTSGANSITVNLTSSSSTGLLSGSFGSAGTASLAIGGSFTLSNTQASGDYSGSFNVTVAYN